MGFDGHESFKHMIDEMLAGGIPVQQEQPLREHLQSCAPCQEYLAASNRVIAGLGGFSFAVDPKLNARVSESLRVRAQQIKAPGRRQLVLSCILALVLTAVGSFFDLRLSSLIASVFDIQRMQVQQDLIAFWILPSVCLLLLFPILPLLSAGGSNQKERNL